MKRLLSGGLALLLAATLLLTCTGAESLRPARQTSLRLADGLVLQGSYLQGGGEYDENVLYYAPDGGVSPIVAYGSTLYGRSSMDYIQQLVAKDGMTVTAGINASFFDFASGIPYGELIDQLLELAMDPKK